MPPSRRQPLSSRHVANTMIDAHKRMQCPNPFPVSESRQSQLLLQFRSGDIANLVAGPDAQVPGRFRIAHISNDLAAPVHAGSQIHQIIPIDNAAADLALALDVIDEILFGSLRSVVLLAELHETDHELPQLPVLLQTVEISREVFLA